MSRIVPEKLSRVYRVIQAKPTDASGLLELYQSNRSYFEYFAIDSSEERLIEDMTILPDGCNEEHKHFLAYYDGGEPVAILDLIEGYPSERICYIGLFMVRAELHGQGIGSGIITELCDNLKSLDFEAVRLAYGRDYSQGLHFWTKNGFVPLREAVHDEYGELIVAQREL